jgi:hypothetical protein
MVMPSQRVRGVPCPIGIPQVRASEQTQVGAPRGVLACSVCFGQSDAPMALATNMGILLMLGVVAGVLVPGPTSGFPHTRLGDGVNFNSGVPVGTPNVTTNGVSTKFPFLPTPLAGRR